MSTEIPAPKNGLRWQALTFPFQQGVSVPAQYRPAGGAVLVDMFIWLGSSVGFTMFTEHQVVVVVELPHDSTASKKRIALTRRKVTVTLRKCLPTFAWSSKVEATDIGTGDDFAGLLKGLDAIKKEGDWRWVSPRFSTSTPAG